MGWDKIQHQCYNHVTKLTLLTTLLKKYPPEGFIKQKYQYINNYFYICYI